MRTPAILLAAAALAACETVPNLPSLLAPTPGPMVTSSAKPPFGSYLVDGAGRTLYVLDGTRMTNGTTRCSGACLQAWPPLRATAPPVASAGIDPSRLATVPSMIGPHAAYAGWPLYYYQHDHAPGDTTGHGVTDQWGTWYLLAPSGEPIRSRPY